MIWQDFIIAIAGIIFTVSLSYQVYYGFKNKKGLITLPTASLTIIGAFATTVAYFTLSLYFSAIVGSINTAIWLILFIQRIIYVKV